MVDYAVEGYQPIHDVRLVVFPEFAHAAPIYQTVEKLRERLAVPIPNEHTERYQRKARALGVYIQTGTFLEVDSRWPGQVFNTTCLIGPEGIVSRYRKVHPWIPWEVHTSPHDLAGYEALAGAEVLVRVSAYMDPWGTAEPTDWWTLVNRARAVENMAYVVAANQGSSLANYPPFSWPGGSMIVDFDGRVLARAEAGPGERIVVGPIDLAALRYERERRQGHHLLGHLRNETYTAYGRTIYPGGRESAVP
jgi:predicted amidohydrolase